MSRHNALCAPSISIVAALSLAALLVVNGTVRAAEADLTLLGDWRFDEGGGDVAGDSSGHGNDGEILGATWVKGKFGTALHFGGRDAYVTVPAVARARRVSGTHGRGLGVLGARVASIPISSPAEPGAPADSCSSSRTTIAASGWASRPDAAAASKDWTETSASLVQFTPGQLVPRGSDVQASARADVCQRESRGDRQLGLPHWILG